MSKRALRLIITILVIVIGIMVINDVRESKEVNYRIKTYEEAIKEINKENVEMANIIDRYLWINIPTMENDPLKGFIAEVEK